MNYVLFKSNEEVWYDKLNELKTYIENHNKLPYNSDKEDNIKSLARWVQTQKRNYIKKQKIMEFENIRKEWENILSQYRHLFMTREEFWRYKLKTLSEYIDKNEKLPSIRDIDDNVKLSFSQVDINICSLLSKLARCVRYLLSFSGSIICN